MFREVGQSLSILGEFQSPRGEGPEQPARALQVEAQRFVPLHFFIHHCLTISYL